MEPPLPDLVLRIHSLQCSIQQRIAALQSHWVADTHIQSAGGLSHCSASAPCSGTQNAERHSSSAATLLPHQALTQAPSPEHTQASCTAATSAATYCRLEYTWLARLAARASSAWLKARLDECGVGLAGLASTAAARLAPNPRCATCSVPERARICARTQKHLVSLETQ